MTFKESHEMTFKEYYEWSEDVKELKRLMDKYFIPTENMGKLIEANDGNVKATIVTVREMGKVIMANQPW